MRVLVVKTSSLGDIVHTLPALTDAKRAYPNIVFDWLTEEAFAEVPHWHPAVAQVIPVALRRWRKQIMRTLLGNEWRRCREQLREHRYDCVIDAQGLLKSALLARQVGAPIVGLDKNSAREPVATRFYQRKVAVSWQLHAVERVRALFAQALEYPLPSERGDYGLDKNQFIDIVPRRRHVVFLHGTTRADKHWPDIYWQQLCRLVAASDCQILLPWGNETERQRALFIAAGAAHVEVLPRLNLHGLAAVIATSSAVVAVDTGLGHLTAALDVPAISLYGPTSPAKIGTYGKFQIHLCAAEQPPLSATPVEPRIMAPLTPAIVWRELAPLLAV
jgi:lipopolysaccharide heptosyltransferase I